MKVIVENKNKKAYCENLQGYHYHFIPCAIDDNCSILVAEDKALDVINCLIEQGI